MSDISCCSLRANGLRFLLSRSEEYFRECGVDVHDVAEPCSEGYIRVHPHCGFLNQVGGMSTHGVAAYDGQSFVVLRYDEFQQSLCGIHAHGLAVGSVERFPAFVVQSLDLAFILGQSHARHLRMGEDSRRHDAEPDVVGQTKDIPLVCRQYNIDLVIFAIPSCSEEERKRIMGYCSESGCRIKTVPYLSQLWLDDDSDHQILSQVKDIKIASFSRYLS